MQIFKFGGASVKDADSVKNVCNIIKKYGNDKVVIIISAMGKMTNAFELLVSSCLGTGDELRISLNAIVDYHNDILWELFPDRKRPIYQKVNLIFHELEDNIEKYKRADYDFLYDQLVCYGEILSTTIISYYLTGEGIENTWQDARNLISTNDTYREGKVNWNITEDKIKRAYQKASRVLITQGFIASDNKGYSTTLGREGSDYSAAIFAYCLNATEMSIWKDVPGVLNADPKVYPQAQKLNTISYHEAIELSFYGASVIHPKTIKPLQNKKIKLYVKSFISPDDDGTIICDSTDYDGQVPSFIFKQNQVLISILPKDFSFIMEENLTQIFALLSKYKIRLNIMQNSAVSFSLCFDFDKRKTQLFTEELSKNFEVKKYTEVELITIRHFNETIIRKLTEGKTIYMHQKNMDTVRYIVNE